MALPVPDLPLPPELADDPPISDDALAMLTLAAADLAADTGIDPGDAIEQLAEDDSAPRWAIDGLGTAEWAMRHVAAVDAELAQLADQRNAWVERITAWFDHATPQLVARRAFFVGHLERWAAEQRELTGKASYVLPSGTVRTREAKPKVQVADEAAVIAWADRALTADDRAMVTPQPGPPARKVYVLPLRDVARIAEVIDHARLTFADGEVVDWVRTDWLTPANADKVAAGALAGDSCPRPGDGYPPGAGPDEGGRLVARLQVLVAHDEVLGPDGQQVPGTYIEAGGITATVTAEGGHHG